MSNENQLKKGSLGLLAIVFFVVAAASPLTGAVGGLPIAFFIGNGAGVPGVYLLAGLLLFLFSFGFVAMSRYVINSGAFYAYIIQGLGITCGLSGLNLALLGYTCMQLAVSSMFGFFTDQLIQSFDLHSPLSWWMYAIIMQVIVVILGIAKVEIGGKILGILLLCEIGIIFLLDLFILKQPLSFEFSSFTPSIFFAGNFGISMVFAICSFIGFEATAIYAEECKHPQTTIPRATFIAVTIITLFFAFSAWALVQFIGAQNIAQIAAADPNLFIFNIAEQLLGSWSIQVMSILLVTSLFAASQAFHNSLSRYLFTMGRDKLFWSKIAKTHPIHQTPYVASIIQGVFMIIMLLVFGISQLDPMTDVFAWSSLLGSMTVLILQIGVSIAAIRFFQRNHHLPVSLWSRMIAPFLATLGMLFVLFNVLENIKVLSGSSSSIILILPFFIILCFAVAVLTSQYLKRKDPSLYAKLGQLIKLV
ncbi:APC family permease [Acinetobacter qingfengensis]|uniref:Amino acid permease n=1 Tax=Acinetobacter qingfengensis TaxID=1262585 RepID=A0A1E7R4X6_9GAMM|nr:APC family permease [Acinetobacter qingfengensis]KAA8732366.1 APC family permease [Acinetobacter qingfengensis]OEY94361.1 amino acid permease [Acinetobacter qingfengensis]